MRAVARRHCAGGDEDDHRPVSAIPAAGNERQLLRELFVRWEQPIFVRRSDGHRLDDSCHVARAAGRRLANFPITDTQAPLLYRSAPIMQCNLGSNIQREPRLS
jgi:hypothetical protein